MDLCYFGIARAGSWVMLNPTALQLGNRKATVLQLGNGKATALQHGNCKAISTVNTYINYFR